jgi:hypothetical protein
MHSARPDILVDRKICCPCLTSNAGPSGVQLTAKLPYWLSYPRSPIHDMFWGHCTRYMSQTSEEGNSIIIHVYVGGKKRRNMPRAKLTRLAPRFVPPHTSTCLRLEAGESNQTTNEGLRLARNWSRRPSVHLCMPASLGRDTETADPQGGLRLR